MMNRYSLDRFKKAQSAEPFSVNTGAVVQSAAASAQACPLLAASQVRPQPPAPVKPTQTEPAAQASSSIGGGQSGWQPPDWAVEPRPGLYWLDVFKDGEVVDKINLEKKRHLFGRQAVMCDFVLDHPSVSRQHAAVVQHKNGGVYVIDLGSAHGTFVANERLSKDSPIELEVGQSLKFAASTRSYVLRKGVPQVPQLAQPPVDFVLPPPPDPSNEDAVVAYNTLLNKLGIFRPNGTSGLKERNALQKKPTNSSNERAAKKPRKSKVTFRDQYGGILVEVVGISDGADVGTEPGPLVKEGSLVGRFDSLVEITVIPKDKDSSSTKVSNSNTSKGVTEKLQQYLEKVKSPGKGGLYGDLYGDAPGVSVGSSWAKGTSGLSGGDEKDKVESTDRKIEVAEKMTDFDDDLDDLFGDAGS